MHVGVKEAEGLGFEGLAVLVALGGSDEAVREEVIATHIRLVSPLSKYHFFFGLLWESVHSLVEVVAGHQFAEGTCNMWTP